MQTVLRLQEAGFLADEQAAQILSNPEKAVDLMREIMGNPESFGLPADHEETLRERGKALTDRIRNSMDAGMSFQEATDAVKKELRQ